MNDELLSRVIICILNGTQPDAEDMIAIHKLANPEDAAKGEAASDHRTPEETAEQMERENNPPEPDVAVSDDPLRAGLPEPLPRPEEELAEAEAQQQQSSDEPVEPVPAEGIGPASDPTPEPEPGTTDGEAQDAIS